MKTLKILLLITLFFPTNSLLSAEQVEAQSANYSDKFMALLYEKAVDYTGKGEVAVEKTIEFLSEQAAPTMEEYIKWSIIGHLWDGAPFIIILILSVPVLIGFWRWAKLNFISGSVNIQGVSVYTSAIALVVGFSGTFVGGPNSTSAMTDLKLATQAYYSPRIYIMHQLNEYMKDSRK